MKKNKAKKQIYSNQNLQGFIMGHHDLLHGSCLFFKAWIDMFVDFLGGIWPPL